MNFVKRFIFAKYERLWLHNQYFPVIISEWALNIISYLSATYYNRKEEKNWLKLQVKSSMILTICKIYSYWYCGPSHYIFIEKIISNFITSQHAFPFVLIWLIVLFWISKIAFIHLWKDAFALQTKYPKEIIITWEMI